MLIINIYAESAPELVLPGKIRVNLGGNRHFRGCLNLQSMRVHAGNRRHR